MIKITFVYAISTCLFFMAGLVAPLAVLTETTVAVLLVLWLLYPYVMLVAYLYPRSIEWLKRWGVVE